MKRLYGGCICFILADLLGMAVATAPTWTTTSPITIESTDLATKCDSVTFLRADSGDTTAVSFSLESQDPDGGFSIGNNADAGEDELRCTAASITPPASFTVVVRAIQASGNGQFTDLTLSIDVTVIGPTCSQGTSLSLATGDSTSCSSVASLTCTSTDSSTVTYSVQSQNPDAGFDVTSSTLTCTQSSVTDGTYTVVVRVTNSGNSGTTDMTFTITAADSGPSCTQETALSLDTSDSTSCNSVASLTCTSTDSSTVTYSVLSQSPDAGFDVTSSTLTCTQSSVTDGTYTVVVRTTNSGNMGIKDITFTVTAASTSGSGSGLGSSNDRNNTGKIVGGVIGGVVGTVVLVAVVYIICKTFFSAQKVPKEKAAKNQVDISGESPENTNNDKRNMVIGMPS